MWFNVYRFRFQANDDKELPIESTKKTRIEDLNDDCILEIFSLVAFPLMDLFTLEKTCKRFQQIARQAFPTILDISIIYADKSYSVVASKSGGRRSLTEKYTHVGIETIFRNCGSNLRGIIIQDTENLSMERPSFLLNLVSTYCVNSVSSSDVNCVETPEVQTEEPEQIIKRLQSLDLRCLNIKDGFDSFADFESLVELKVSYVNGSSSILETIFPHLERFTFIDRYTDDFSWQTFILCHPRLKMLHVHIYMPDINVNVFLQGICDICLHLEELSFRFGHSMEESFPLSLLPLQSLNRLKTLKLWFLQLIDLSFVSAMTNLHELCLHFCDLPNDELVYLTQLTTLRIFRDGSSDLDVVNVIRRLVNLVEFEVQIFVLNEETFKKIVRIVRGRPQMLTLRCIPSFDYNYNENCVESQRVRIILIKLGLLKD